MVKDHTDSDRCRHIGYSFRLAARALLYATDKITHTTAFVTPVVEHWLEQEIAQWVHPMKDRSDDPSHHERTLLPRSYISLLYTIRDRVMFSKFSTRVTFSSAKLETVITNVVTTNLTCYIIIWDRFAIS